MEKNYSFEKGFKKVQLNDVKRAKEELMKSLHINSRTQWYMRLYGRVIPNMEEKESIEKILLKYGVDESEIWGR